MANLATRRMIHRQAMLSRGRQIRRHWRISWNATFIRAKEKAKRKAKLEQRKAEEPNHQSYGSYRKILKKTYESKSKSDFHVAFDMSFGDLMNQRDRGKCLKQVMHCYSLNRRFDTPLNLHMTSFDGVMKEEMGQRHQGYQQ